MTREIARQHATDAWTRATYHADDTRNSTRDQREQHATTCGTARATGEKIK
jgi:hypothetical protein